jgi:hypothetical protein
MNALFTKGFDVEIHLRTWVLGALGGLLAKQAGWQVTSEEAAASGVLLGWAYDKVAFHLKVWIASRNQNKPT